MCQEAVRQLMMAILLQERQKKDIIISLKVGLRLYLQYMKIRRIQRNMMLRLQYPTCLQILNLFLRAQIRLLRETALRKVHILSRLLLNSWVWERMQISILLLQIILFCRSTVKIDLILRRCSLTKSLLTALLTAEGIQ